MNYTIVYYYDKKSDKYISSRQAERWFINEDRIKGVLS
jgi:hypothetical protein